MFYLQQYHLSSVDVVWEVTDVGGTILEQYVSLLPTEEAVSIDTPSIKVISSYFDDDLIKGTLCRDLSMMISYLMDCNHSLINSRCSRFRITLN